MTILEILHKLILGPIELLFDVIFAFSMQMTQSPVLSIVVLSLAINLLVLPLYKRADAMQQEERDVALRLKPGMDHIKKTFSGDERFMVQQIYYRQNHYKPYYALRGSLSLLLQIPFFMAAYNFLSGLNVLRGVSFGPIADLAAPDGILKIGGLAINLLPILMTLINIVSGMLYTKGMPLKTKIQLYGMALIFLVLLYDSPAGLVFYWTLNNLFSLGKNIFNKIPNPKKVLRIACSAAGLALAAFFIIKFNELGSKKAALGIAVAAAAQIPLVLHLLKKLFRNKPEKSPEEKQKTAKEGGTVFIVCCILLTVLTGLLIPSAVISTSPAEFVETGENFRSPLIYVLHSFLLAAGFFLVWCVIFYLLTEKENRTRIAPVFAVLALAAVVNYMFFGNGYGRMSSTCVFDTDIWDKITSSQKLLNAGVLLALAGVVLFVWKKKPAILKFVCMMVCLAVSAMSLVNIFSINGRIPEIRRLADQGQSSEENRIVHLNKSGKNVIVFMLDRAPGFYMPFMVNEKPELKDQFAGFTCYLNTLSYGRATNTGSPSLFGGYEYTPRKLNARADELMKDKQNEALRVMPLNFLENGFDVTVCDPPYANYEWIPDLTIYSDYPEIETYLTEWGRFDEKGSYGAENKKAARQRNMFCYSIFRISPVLIHSELYDEGNYNKTDTIKVEYGVSSIFSTLTHLPDMTRVQDEEKNTFLMIANSTTHDTAFYQEPEYILQDEIDNTEYDAAHPTRISQDGRELLLDTEDRQKHYQSNMAAMLQLGKWMDYLREKGVYDNTRIIIVADHGPEVYYEKMTLENPRADIGGFNPLLLVKDFDSNEPFAFSNEFMTNADTPAIAFSGLIDNPVNPATGKPVTDEDKQADPQVVVKADFNIDPNGTTFRDMHWFTVKTQDIMNPENWSAAE